MTSVAVTDRVPARLFIAWQDPDGRRYHPVAVLRHDDFDIGGSYVFRYLKNAGTVDGFAPFVAFPDLHTEYRSPDLFSFFTNRVMSSRRPDYPQFLEALGLSGDAAALDVLGRLGARATDSIEVFPEPEVDRSSGRMTTRFFVRGIRHLEGAEPVLSALGVGEHLSLAADAENPVNRLAIHVATESGSVIGWVPDYLVAPLRRAVGDHLDLADVVAERVNPPGTPRQTRVLCRIEVPVSPGFAPFDGPEFLEIDASPDLR
jgi:hypothetical protein